MLRKETRDRLRRLNSHRNKKATQIANSRTADTKPSPTDRLRSQLASKLAKYGLADKSMELALPKASALSAGKEVVTKAGKHWLVQRQLNDLWPNAAENVATWQRLPPRPVEQTAATPTASPNSKRNTAAQRKSQQKQHQDYEAFRASFPDRCVFLDLETCGLAGSTIFLTGMLYCSDGNWLLSQHWARNYSEERAMLQSARECLSDQHVLVTFNGKSFDWPQVRDRCTLHAGTADCGLPELIHLDLLHLSRQRWKTVLPDCKLQTLERFICGRHRAGDIAGRDIPAAYDDYVRTGHIAQMDNVLHHNALDLITLLEVAMCWDERTVANRCT